MRAARLKVSPAFSKAAGCRGSAPARAPLKRGILLCSNKRRRGSKGEPSPGVPPFSFWFVRVRRYVGRGSLACPAIRPHFFGACPKKRCRAAKEKRFYYPGGSTIRVSATASVVFTHLRPTWGGDWWLTGRSGQLDAVGCDVGASSPWERRVGPNSPRGGTQKRVSLGLHPVSLRKSKEMGWNGQLVAAAFAQEIGAHVTAPDKHQPPAKVGRETSRLPTCSAHANGGATEVKKRLSLAARHRFFGQAPKKWGRIAGQANDHLPTYRRTRTKAKKIRGGTPGEGSPLDSTTFGKVDETFKRAARSTV